MQDITTEFSFILKPAQHGIGVFAIHNIKQGTYLSLFGKGDALADRSCKRKIEDVPELFRQYCINHGDTLICPEDFSCMAVGWYLNHSKNSNATRDEKYNWYASRDISSGEEITIDYNSLEEPEEAKEEYYK